MIGTISGGRRYERSKMWRADRSNPVDYRPHDRRWLISVQGLGAIDGWGLRSSALGLPENMAGHG